MCIDQQEVSLNLLPDQYNAQQRTLRQIERRRGFRADDSLRLRLALRGAEVVQLNQLDSELNFRRDPLHGLAAFGNE